MKEKDCEDDINKERQTERKKQRKVEAGGKKRVEEDKGEEENPFERYGLLANVAIFFLESKTERKKTRRLK